MEDTRVEILDSLRTFAALSVCLFHFICTVTGFIQEKWILQIFHQGKYGVQLFFVISGFVIPWAMYHAKYKLKDFFSFFLKRLARLEPPYLFSILLALCILYLRENYLGRSNDHIVVSSKQVLLHFGYLIPFFHDYQWLNDVYWTLAIEFQYYLLIALLFIPLVKVKLYGRLIIYIIILLCSYIGDATFLPYWAPVFLLGMILFLYMTQIIKDAEYYSVSAFLILFCFYKYPVMAVVYAIVPLIAVLKFRNVKISGLHFLGKFSYSIYLIHPLIGASIINVLSHNTFHPLAKIGLILLGLFFTLISSWITYIFIEKPSKKLSASIRYRK